MFSFCDSSNKHRFLTHFREEWLKIGELTHSQTSALWPKLSKKFISWNQTGWSLWGARLAWARSGFRLYWGIAAQSPNRWPFSYKYVSKYLQKFLTLEKYLQNFVWILSQRILLSLLRFWLQFDKLFCGQMFEVNWPDPKPAAGVVPEVQNGPKI